MLRIQTTSEFESDFRRIRRLGKDPELFWELVAILANEELIPAEYRDHELSGRWSGIRDVHIETDWLLLYQIVGSDLVLVRTGRHKDLF